MAKRSTKVKVVNNHFENVEIPLLSGEKNYVLKPGEEADLDFDPETPQMRAYRHVSILVVRDGDREVPVDFGSQPLAAGETVTAAPSDKPASAL